MCSGPGRTATGIRAWSAAVAVLATLATPLEARAQTGPPVEVSVGITNVLADVGHYIADKRGYFAAEGLKVRLVTFDAAARMITPLAAGELDVGGGGVAAGLFNAVARGIGLKIVADKSSSKGAFSPGALMVRKDLVEGGRYKALADLKGAKLAVPAPGTATSTSISRHLATAAMSLKDVELVYLSFPNMVSALQNKGVEAAFLTEPSVTAVTDAGTAVPIVRDAEMFPDHQIAVTLYSERFIRTPGNVAVRFMRALLRGTRDYNDAVSEGRFAGPAAEGVIAILTEYALIKDASVYRRITVHGCDPDGALNLKSLEADLAFFVSEGLIKGNVRVADAIDTSIAAAAVRDLGHYKRK